MAKGKEYKISTIFSANNVQFLKALDKNAESLNRCKDNAKKFDSQLSNLWNATHRASRGVRTLGDSVKASTIAMGNLIASGVKTATRTIVGLGVSCVQSASDAQEMQQKFNTVFKGMENDAEKWSKNFVKKVGGSVLTVKREMANTQDLLTGFGAGRDDAFELSKQIQSLGTDLAAFNNMSEGEAVDRLRKGLLGEHENLKALGIIINENALKQELSSRGDKRKLQTLTELEKIELRYAIAIKQSTNAIGSAERESDGFARQIETLKGNVQNLAVTVGSKLLPPLTSFVTYVNENFEVIVVKIKASVDGVIAKFKEWGPVILRVTMAFAVFKAIMTVGGVIQSVASFIGLLNSLRKSQLLVTAAQQIMNVVLTMNPIGLVITAIAGAILVFANWEKIIKVVTNALQNCWNWFKKVLGFGGSTVQANVNTNVATNSNQGDDFVARALAGSSTTNNKTNNVKIDINQADMSPEDVAGILVPEINRALSNS